MRRLALGLAAALAAGAGGCRNTCSRVESELAARESDVRVLKDDLARAEGLSATLFRELAAHRGVPGPNGVVERPTPAWPVKSLAVGSRTAGRFNEALGGDDALEVQLDVRDVENQPMKAPGCVLIEALGVTPEGLKQPLGVWELRPEELRGRWEQGLITTGYLLTVPWQTWPTTDQVRVQVRFTLIDGRAFEADRTVRVRPVAKMAAPVVPPAPMLPPPTPTPMLPAPKEPTLPAPTEGPALPAVIGKPTAWKAD